MSNQQFVKDLVTLLNRRQGEIAQKLINGAGVSSMEDYKAHTGHAKGLAEAGDIAYQLMKQRELADDDDGTLGEMPDDDGLLPVSPAKVKAKVSTSNGKRRGRR